MVGVNSRKAKGSNPPIRSQNSNHQGQHIQLWSTVHEASITILLQYYFMINSSSYEGPRMGCKAIADLYGLPCETFRHHTTGELKGYCGHLSGGKNKVLTPNEELELASHIGNDLIHGCIIVLLNESSYRQDKRMDKLNLFIDYHTKCIVSII